MPKLVRAEFLARIHATRSFLRIVDSYEKTLANGDDASRSAKSMIFIHNYAVYEFVVTQAVKFLVVELNGKNIAIDSIRPELLSMVLDPEFSSVIALSLKKTWSARSKLLRKAHSTNVATIQEDLFPKDGTHYRADQLDTIWGLFGLPGSPISNQRLRAHIGELVNTRNELAHGSDAPSRIGGRFSISELEKRIDDTECVCTEVLDAVLHYASSATPFI